MLIALDARCRGSSHVKENKPCQDSCESFADTYLGLAIVADGHGGEKYFRSDVGSHEAVFRSKLFAYKLLKGHIDSFIKKKDETLLKKNFDLLKSQIVSEWRQMVENHYKLHEITEKELEICKSIGLTKENLEKDIPVIYGSTLLIAGYIEKYSFWFALQIGDGKCVVLKTDGTAFSPPDLENEKLGFGVTTSLCGKNAGAEFRYAFGFEKIAGICVMSDGLTDSFDTEKLPDFLLNIKNNAVADVGKTKTELEEFLPKLSEQGSGDDISIAGIFVREEESKIQKIVGKVGKLV